MSRVTSVPILPATVAAEHLRACAAELAGDAGIGGLADVGVIVPALAHAQRDISVALAAIAEHTRLVGAADGVGSDELAALVDVLRAASAAAGHTADALAETLPLLENPAEGDTRL